MVRKKLLSSCQSSSIGFMSLLDLEAREIILNLVYSGVRVMIDRSERVSRQLS